MREVCAEYVLGNLLQLRESGRLAHLAPHRKELAKGLVAALRRRLLAARPPPSLRGGSSLLLAASTNGGESPHSARSLASSRYTGADVKQSAQHGEYTLVPGPAFSQPVDLSFICVGAA